MARRRNPVPDVIIYAAGTTFGIVVGTVLATWIVESLRACGSLPGSGMPSPMPLPSNSPAPGTVAGVVMGGSET